MRCPRPSLPVRWASRAPRTARYARWAARAAGLALILFAAGLFVFPPPLERLSSYPTGGILRDCEGAILRVTLNRDQADCRPIRTLREAGWCAPALIAAEDQRFYTHHGVDPLALARALRQNISNLRRISGASTLTMQLVRLLRPAPRRNAYAKTKEMFEALALDWRVPKDEILTQVLNRIPMGSNLIGIEAGAQGWFGKQPDALSAAEAALLVGLAQSPTRLRPDRNPAGAIKRQHFILGRMAALGMITPQQCAEAKAQPLAFKRSLRPFAAPHYCDYFLARHLAARGPTPDGHDLRTPLNPTVQRIAEQALAHPAHDASVDLAAVVYSVKDEALIALACTGDYFSPDAGQVNVATAPRSAGSTLKPFLFAQALDCGIIHPATPLFGEPLAYRNYAPLNMDATFARSVPAGHALAQSLNIPSIALLSRLGLTRFYDTLTALPLTTLKPTPDTYGLGLAIGNAPVRLTELAQAYLALAKPGPLYSDEARHLVYRILSGDERSPDIYGHIGDAQLPQFAWKTGTSMGFRDAWTIAYTGDYIVGVWAGHRHGGNKNDARILGRKAAAPVAAEIMQALHPSGRATPIARPDGLEERSVCAESGCAATPHCPHTCVTTVIKGITRLPPCALAHDAPPAASPLRIIRPGPGETLRTGGGPVAVIPHPANGDTLYWYVNDVFQAHLPAHTPFTYLPPAAGAYTIRCATSAGATASVQIRIIL